jgi:LacI family transcriptional regulator
MARESQTSRSAGRGDSKLNAAPARRATINDIARLARVSKKTVSRVINRSPFVKEETRKRVDAIMTELGYVPDPQARGLAFRRSFLIGLVYDNPNAQFVVNAQQGVLDGVRGSGFELVVHPCDRLAKGFLSEVANFVDRQKLFGVVLLPPVSENDKLVELLQERGCNYVRVGSARIDTPERLVMSNDRQVSGEAAKHLVDLGHTRIGLIAGPKGFRSREERRRGFIEGLEASGLKLDAELCFDGAYTFESGVAGAAALLRRSPRPTAIFASNDEMAAGAYQAAREIGLSVPDDVSIVGFDDTPISSRLWPALTTVHWPILEMGQAAARKLVGEADPAEADLVVPARLVVRQSSAPPGGR